VEKEAAMAAKLASRKSSERKIPTGERYHVVSKESGARIYPGPGVDLEEAERLSGTLVAPSEVVPAGEGRVEETEARTVDALGASEAD
jgi:hypothetical protein